LIGPTNRKIVLQLQTAYADAVAGLSLPRLCTAEPETPRRLDCSFS